MQNVNPTTGVRYGVIALHSIEPTLADSLFYSGRNLSEEQAAAELRRELGEKYDLALEEARLLVEGQEFSCAAEHAAVVEQILEVRLKTTWVDSREEYIDWAYERNCDFAIEEPTIEGEHEGVKYRISWLGGAPLLWVLEGPLGNANSLCSPCVPNAADLDAGFEVTDEVLPGYLCYVVPRDWLFTPKEQA